MNIKPIIKTGIAKTNEIGQTVRNIGTASKDYITSKDSFKRISETSKKAGINKDTLIGAVTAITSIILAFKAGVGLKNKILSIIKNK